MEKLFGSRRLGTVIVTLCGLFFLLPNLARSADVKWDQSADVIVVGAGGAGLAAAVSAAEKGATVIVLEKMPVIGGNTIISGGYYNAADPKRQGKQNIQDSAELHFQQTWKAGDNFADPEKVKILTANALDGLHWLEGMGMKFEDTVFQVYGALHPRSHSPLEPRGEGYIRVLKEASDKLGVKILTETPMVSIIRENALEGPVLGIGAVDRNQKPVNFRATKAVVLASGGFGANRELRAAEDARMGELNTHNQPGATGDGILKAMDIGAYAVNMAFVQCNPGPPPGRQLRVSLHIDVSKFITIDKRANRIVAEDARRDQIRDAILSTPEKFGFNIVDNTTFLSYPENTQKTVLRGLETGDAWKGDTLEELASKLKVPADALASTINKYNSYVDKKVDPDFAKDPKNLTHKISNPPFWACFAGMSVHHTMGGLRINTKAQVIDRYGKIIPRLYAAGEVTGGVHGTNRVGGNALADIIVYGRIAGANAASEK